ncbi:hypothetical protein [Modicisalibacter sp. 'Wilcox']|uniref:hypothetical protein n=1 Tax=Modicisalibacter sp. 'Wilcox' TaxID=2679914 RepID=UPI0013D7475A|nr:hypothetical protein [Modicisalibacter sp. 'Wilcox']
MKTLCITGSASSQELAHVAKPLYQAGLEPAKALQKGVAIDLRDWHRRVSPMLRHEQPIGRLWEKAAEELLFANFLDKAWGWSDPESLWALDFWADLDPGIHFLLVCESPEAFLARSMLRDSEQHREDAYLEQWRTIHVRMLKFYLSHPDRCVLVDTDQAARAPLALIELVKMQWQLPVERPDITIDVDMPADSLSSQLARDWARAWIVQHSTRLESLRLELEAAQQPLSSGEPPSSAKTWPDERTGAPPWPLLLKLYQEEQDQRTQKKSLAQARADVEQLETRLTEEDRERATLLTENRGLNKRLALAESELSQVQQEKKGLLIALQQSQEQLEQSLSQRQAQQQAFDNERADLIGKLEEYHRDNTRIAALENELGTLRQESESLLITLQQSQEQLEQSLSQRQAQQQAFDNERTDLIGKLEECRRDNTRIAALEDELGTLRRESESLLITLHQTQEQLEQSLSQRQAQQQSFDNERSELSRKLEDTRQENEQLARADQHRQALEKERDTLSADLNMARQQLEAAGEQSSQLQAAEREAERLKQECEALLFSLHRTQEDLEAQTRQGHQQQATRDELQKRVIALKQRGGVLLAADNVKVNRPTPEQVEWRFENVLIGGDEQVSLAVTGALKRGGLVIEVAPESGTPWQLESADQPSLDFLLPEQRLVANVLPELLQGHLAQAVTAPDSKEQWQQALTKLQQQLAEQPPRLAFAKPDLHHVQINPDYEHLWITLRQARFSKSEPMDWQFRLSCANVTPQAFGQHPKLEVPWQRQQLLSGWFDESQDDFGKKLELRFAQPEAMDGEVWNKLPERDRQLLRELILQLPSILQQLEKNGHSPERDWPQWYRLADDMRRILRANIARSA